MLHPEIAYPNAPDLSLLHRLGQRPPRAEPALGTAVRRVQEVQVDVVEAGGAQGVVDAALGAFVGDGARGDLRGEEEGGAGDAGGLERSGRGGFVAVGGCGVDVAVADFEGVPDDVGGYVCRAGSRLSTWSGQMRG